MNALVPDTNINFLRLVKPFGFLSMALVIVSLVLIGTRGLNFGLDFTGGTVVEVGARSEVSLSEVRGALADGGYSDATVQHFGSSRDVMVRVPPHDTDEPDQVGLEIFALIGAVVPDLDLRRVEFVGPQVGDELRDQSGLAMLIAMGLMMVYIWFRFTNKFGIAALIGLIHDVILVLGLFALLQWSFDLTVLAAVLALIGYSLNDTIVVADHIRDDFRNSRMTDAKAIINQALNRTLSRTLVTSLTTIMVLVALYFFGGETLRGFSASLIVGVAVGTYSTMYVVTGLLLIMKINKEEFMVPQAEELDERP